MPTPPRPPGRPGLQASSKPGEDSLARAARERDELAAVVDRLEEEIEELKVRYEMYFLGTERREPIRDREELKKKVLRVKEGYIRNAAMRFRVQSLHARFLSYERLWLRSAREREEGTYRRDLFKARLHARGKAPIGAERSASSAGATASATAASGPSSSAAGHLNPLAPRAAGGEGQGEGGSAKPLAATPVAPPAAAAPSSPTVKPPAPPSAAAPRPATPPAARTTGGKLADSELRALYDQYVAAKKRCNEDVSKLSYEALARSVAKQVPELLAKHKAKSVEFKVVVKDGKAVLKAIPRT